MKKSIECDVLNDFIKIIKSSHYDILAYEKSGEEIITPLSLLFAPFKFIGLLAVIIILLLFIAVSFLYDIVAGILEKAWGKISSVLNYKLNK